MAYCKIISGPTSSYVEIEASANSAAQNDRNWQIILNGIFYDSVYDKSQKINYSFSNLSPNTSYTVTVTYGSTGDEYTAGTVSFTTEQSYENDTGSITLSNITYNSINVNLEITPRNYQRTITFYWYRNSSANGSKQLILGTNKSECYMPMTGLLSDTQYTFWVTATAPDGTQTFISSNVYGTTSNLELSAKSESTYDTVTITAEIDPILTKDINIIFYLKERTDSTYRSVTKTIIAGNSDVSCMFSTDITEATIYDWYVKSSDGQFRYPTSGSSSRRTKNNFSWSTNVAKGVKFNLLASDWNEFTSQLNNKEKYFTSNDRSFTAAVKGENFTAAMFNQAVRAINNIANTTSNGGTTTMSVVSSGDNIYASIINQLADCLNE